MKKKTRGEKSGGTVPLIYAFPSSGSADHRMVKIGMTSTSAYRTRCTSEPGWGAVHFVTASQYYIFSNHVKSNSDKGMNFSISEYLRKEKIFNKSFVRFASVLMISTGSQSDPLSKVA